MLVTVDDRAFQRLVSSAVPPRATIARALDDITAAGPRAIAADIIFTGAVSPRGDAALISGVHRDGARLVLATDTLDAAGQTQLFGRSDQILSDHTVPAAGYAGFPGNPTDPATVVRTMQRSVALPGGAPLDTLGVVAARRSGLSSAATAALPASTWIAFRGGAGTFPRVALADVLAGRQTALAQLRNRIVVLGITAAATHDVHHTSAPGGGLMAGPELQANAISTALRGFPLRDAGRGADVALIVLLGLVPLALALRLPGPQCALGVLAAAAAFCVAAQLAFDSGRVVNVVFPLLSLALSAAAVLAVLLLRARTATAKSHSEPAPSAVTA